MASPSGIESGDRALLKVLDTALAEALSRSGDWLVCRPGCHECCIGPFEITQLDAWRLRAGLAELESRDPPRAARVRERARTAVEVMRPDFPGDPVTGLLSEGAGDSEQFASLAEDLRCPALDPEAGTCDLYEWRPVTCRTFGPAVHCGPSSFVVCELCYRGASAREIADCSVEIDPDGLESRLLEELERSTGTKAMTVVAYALAPAADS